MHTVLLAGQYSRAKDDWAIRATLEGALEVVAVPAHRQWILCSLARAACRVGDVASAERWLERCDERSLDLIIDSDYRLAKAFLAAAQHDYRTVLGVIGRTPTEIPLSQRVAGPAEVLRSHAQDRLGEQVRA